MNDNGLPNDPLAVSQFLIPALVKSVWYQNVDRTNGEYIPGIAGDFLRVESCDLPSRISFNNTDYQQSIPLVSGMIINGDFSGVTIFHDNYSASTAKPVIIFNLGRGKRLEIDNAGNFSALSTPYVVSSQTAVLFGARVSAPGGHKKCLLNVSLQATNAAFPGGFVFTINFVDAALNIISQPVYQKGLTNYSSGGGYVKTVSPVVTGTATVYRIEFSDIFYLPSACDAISLNASYSVTTLDASNIRALFS